MTIAAGIVAAAVVSSLAYCLFLLVVASVAQRRQRPALADALPATRFCILIPAHNEALVLGSTLDMLARLDYPPSLQQTVVIADNCTDATAQIAAGYTGVRVLERENASERGKGYALNWALAQFLPTCECDAYVVVDADTHVDSQFLSAMDRARRARSASGGQFAAQGRYDVLNDDEGWRASLMAGALSLVHHVRPLARESLGLTVGLKGNGMCFDASTLRAVAWSASLTEDIDFAMDLIERLNLPVHYVPDARVAAQMPTTEKASGSQRERWERGRFEILRRRGWRMLGAGLREGNPIKIDAALDLIVPPITQLAALLAAWGALLAVNALLSEIAAFTSSSEAAHGVFLAWKPIAGQGGAVWFAAWGTAAVLLLAYVFVGFAVGGAPKEAYAALLRAPKYALWKLVLLLTPKRGAKQDEWVRTERTAIPAVGADAQPAPEGVE